VALKIAAAGGLADVAGIRKLFGSPHHLLFFHSAPLAAALAAALIKWCTVLRIGIHEDVLKRLLYGLASALWRHSLQFLASSFRWLISPAFQVLPARRQSLMLTRPPLLLHLLSIQAVFMCINSGGAPVKEKEKDHA
jgi:hypothetical protein